MQVSLATTSDIAEIASVLQEGAAWMTTKGCPAWTASDIGPEFIAPLVARQRFVVARSAGELAGVCTLSPSDPQFWPDDPPGLAAYLHKLAITRSYSGGRVTGHILEACRDIARQWGCCKLRLDCHPMIRSLYERLGFSYVDTMSIRRDYSDGIVVDRLEMDL